MNSILERFDLLKMVLNWKYLHSSICSFMSDAEIRVQHDPFIDLLDARPLNILKNVRSVMCSCEEEVAILCRSKNHHASCRCGPLRVWAFEVIFSSSDIPHSCSSKITSKHVHNHSEIRLLWKKSLQNGIQTTSTSVVISVKSLELSLLWKLVLCDPNLSKSG